MGKSTTELNRVIKALKAGENIEKIDLYKNKIGNKQIGLLVQALLENNTVKRINLDCNEIDDKGAMLIAKLLEGNKFIDGVYLHRNKISNKGAKCLIQALENNDRILSLDLSGNKKIGLGLQQDVMKLLHRNILKTVETLPYQNEQVDQAKEDSVWLWLMKKKYPFHFLCNANTVARQKTTAYCAKVKRNAAAIRRDYRRNRSTLTRANFSKCIVIR